MFFSYTKFLQSFIRTGKDSRINYYSMLQKFLACHIEQENRLWKLLCTAVRKRLGMSARNVKRQAAEKLERTIPDKNTETLPRSRRRPLLLSGSDAYR